VIDVTCPQCGEVYHADPVHVGKQIRCRRCSSLLLILGAAGTIVKKPPEANGVRQYQPRADARSALPNQTLGLASIVAVVVVITAALAILLWHSRPNQDRTSAVQTGIVVSQKSLETGSLPMAPQEPVPTEQEPRYEVVDPSACDEHAPHSSMANGSRIIPDVGATGHGVLDVQNGTGDDAVIFLTDSASEETIREVYVEAGHSIQVKGIPKGTYELSYTHGIDWAGDDIFHCGQDYARFERDLPFKEESDQEGTHYNSITVTLHSVVGGNIHTKRISRQEFLKNHRGTDSRLR
jgi:phage FluMu protein Com